MEATKLEILKDITFGQRVAEDEDALEQYFVETDQWRRIYRGSVDIVFGSKGTGKSAIYTLLQKRKDDLRANGIIVVPGENPRGNTAFSQLSTSPPTSEREFVGLWKIYILLLAAQALRSEGIENTQAKDVVGPLVEAGLLDAAGATVGFQQLVRRVRDYVRSLVKAEGIEGGVVFDPVTGAPVGVTGKITLREPSSEARIKGLVSVDSLLSLADHALHVAGAKIWIALDRLDVAFAESHDLEENALRALFRAYLDMLSLRQLGLKVFLRDDIWGRITQDGFREASHITRTITLTWDGESLRNLLVRRLLQNDSVVGLVGCRPVDVLDSVAEQEKFFYQVFPAQIDSGPNKPTAFDWMLSRTRDGSKRSAPRELVHLLTCARDEQIAKLEKGYAEPPNGLLFDRQTIKDALDAVSRARFEQTLCAEYPRLAKRLRQLSGQKTEHSATTLASVWSTSQEESRELADSLVAVGFFEERESAGETRYWVPFLYRAALEMVQGKAC